MTGNIKWKGDTQPKYVRHTKDGVVTAYSKSEMDAWDIVYPLEKQPVIYSKANKSA